jgi:hypothetical protein
VIAKAGGYEAESSLINYGYCGPLLGGIETLLLDRVQTLLAGLRHQP